MLIWNSKIITKLYYELDSSAIIFNGTKNIKARLHEVILPCNGYIA